VNAERAQQRAIVRLSTHVPIPSDALKAAMYLPA
jgi:hypothetical protein